MKIFDENTSNINNLIDESISNIKSLMETNTIIGDPVIAPDGTIIIPISKVSVGFIVGGGEYSDKSSRRVAKHYPMAGGSGGGTFGKASDPLQHQHWPCPPHRHFALRRAGGDPL